MLEADLWRGEARAQAEEMAEEEQQQRIGHELGEKRAVVVDGVEVEDKEAGLRQWRWEVEMRFVRGQDEEFDYAVVDQGDSWERDEERERQERWFEEEEAAFLSADDTEAGDHGNGEHEVKETKRRRELQGETGVQDF